MTKENIEKESIKVCYNNNNGFKMRVFKFPTLYLFYFLFSLEIMPSPNGCEALKNYLHLVLNENVAPQRAFDLQKQSAALKGPNINNFSKISGSYPEKLVRSNATLNNQGRKQLINDLYPQLNENQINAVIEAHKNPSCAIYKCTPEQLRMKANIMKKANIPASIRKDVIKRGIAGNIEDIVPSVEENSRRLDKLEILKYEVDDYLQKFSSRHEIEIPPTEMKKLDEFMENFENVQNKIIEDIPVEKREIDELFIRLSKIKDEIVHNMNSTLLKPANDGESYFFTLSAERGLKKMTKTARDKAIKLLEDSITKNLVKRDVKVNMSNKYKFYSYRDHDGYYIIAYEIIEGKVKVLMIGPHENFYTRFRDKYVD